MWSRSVLERQSPSRSTAKSGFASMNLDQFSQPISVTVRHGSVSPTASYHTHIQGRRSWGWGVRTPWKYVGGVRVCFDPAPQKVTFFHSKVLLYNCKFHSIKDEQLDTITSQILLMLTMLHLYVWSAQSRQCPPFNAFAAPLATGPKVIVTQDKLQNVGAGDPPSTILIHGLPTNWRCRGVHLPWQ